MENVRYLYRRDGNTSVKRIYVCEDCGEEGPNRGKNRILRRLLLDADGVWRNHKFCQACYQHHEHRECFQAALDEMISEQISPGTPKCEHCGSWNTAHYLLFKWQCQNCKKITPGRGFKKGDLHIQELR